jgi:succinate dehydrogenase / fumarate reductase iron-sulfur subunit
MAETILVHVTRRKSAGAPPYVESFEVPRVSGMNVISLLQAIRRDPVNTRGEKVEPVAWDCGCLEEVCGACTMNINGRVRQACAALVDNLELPIRLEPMSKFPVVRDLIVDRAQMFRNLQRVRGWIPIDGTYDLGPGPRMPEAERLEAYWFSRCMTCGCCLEACPQFLAIEGEPEKDDAKFMGAQIIGQVRLFNAHPTGAMNAHERLEALMGPGGIQDCGNAQNCVEVCPKDIPLLEAIGELGAATTRNWLRRIFAGKPPRHAAAAE